MYYSIAFIVLLVLLYFVIIRRKKSTSEESLQKPEEEPIRQIASDCCGAHEVCEFDESLLNNEEIIYFEDEELDKFRNLREDQFTAVQIDELREVLYTLRTNEINKWLVSLSRRHIHLPVVLQQEARQLLVES